MSMRHTFEMDGIFINPELPEGFDFTPNEERDDKMNWWWDKPYILIEELFLESWEEHYHRLKDDSTMKDYLAKQNKELWEKELQDRRESWLNTWHTGFRYDVRCLDGGAWDRSTSHGMFATFEEALLKAKELL